ALLTVDAGPHGGAVVALDPSGRTRPIATFPDGPDPIAPIPKLQSSTGSTRAASPGLYVNDDKTGYTYMAPAASVASYAGDVIVGRASRRRRPQSRKARGKRDPALSSCIGAEILAPRFPPTRAEQGAAHAGRNARHRA